MKKGICYSCRNFSKCQIKSSEVMACVAYSPAQVYVPVKMEAKMLDREAKSPKEVGRRRIVKLFFWMGKKLQAGKEKILSRRKKKIKIRKTRKLKEIPKKGEKKVRMQWLSKFGFLEMKILLLSVMFIPIIVLISIVASDSMILVVIAVTYFFGIIGNIIWEEFKSGRFRRLALRKRTEKRTLGKQPIRKSRKTKRSKKRAVKSQKRKRG